MTNTTETGNDQIITISDEKYRVKCTERYDATNTPVLEIFEEDGFPAGVISICLPNPVLLPLEENETAICGDVPQEEVIRELVRIGLVEDTGRIELAGYGSYPVVKVLNPPAKD